MNLSQKGSQDSQKPLALITNQDAENINEYGCSLYKKQAKRPLMKYAFAKKIIS